MNYHNPETVPSVWQVGDVILDKYEVKQIFTGGGMGLVYGVHHREWGMDMAVKSPRAEYFRTQQHIDNFEREAETWVNLGLHPHTASCYYVRRLGGIPRIFTEFVDGGSMADWIQSRRLYEGGPDRAMERILDFSIQFAWGLHYAHEQGLIHQDVKPGNVLVRTDGNVKVSDFGLAKARALAGETTMSTEGRSILVTSGGMTPAYCSPEQANGKPLSRKTDIWSWAISIFEMFAGEPPCRYGGQLASEVLEVFLEDNNSDDHLPSMPNKLADLLKSCFRQDPASRTQSLSDCVALLCEVYMAETGIHYPRPEPEAAHDTADALSNRALSLIDLGKPDEAETLIYRALELNKSHLAATYNINLMRWRKAECTDEEVLTAIEKIREEQPNNWHAECALGWLLTENANFSQALFHFDKAVELGGKNEAARGSEMARRLSQAGAGQCLRIFEGHTDSIHSVVFSPDGHFALSGGGGGYGHEKQAIRLWRIATGQCLQFFEGHDNRLTNAVALFLYDGRYAISGGHHSDIRLWQISTGNCLRTFDSTDQTICCMAISSDGHFLVTAGASAKMWLWDVGTGKRLHAFDGPMSVILSLAISPDGRLLLSGDSEKTMRLWELASGKCLRTFEGHHDAVTAIAFSPDGLFAMSGSGSVHDDKDRTIRLWEVGSGRLLRTFNGHKSRISSLAYSPDGRFVISGSNDKTLRLWDVANGRCLRTFGEHQDKVNAVAYSPDGCLVLSGSGAHPGSQDKTIRLWDVGTVIEKRQISPWFYSVALTASEAEKRQRSHEAHLACTREALDNGGIPEAMLFLKRARKIPGFEKSRESLELQARVGARSRIKSFGGGWLKRTFEGHTSYVTAVAFSPDGLAALSGGNGVPRLWEVATGKCLRTFPGHSGFVTSIAFSPNGHLAISGAADNTLRLWGIHTGECLRTFVGHTNFVNAVDFTTDGRFVISGSGVDSKRKADWDHTLRIWEVATGRCLQNLDMGINGPVNCITLSPDGRFALCGCGCSLWLWDLEAGQCLRTFEGAGLCSGVQSVAFSPDGRLALSGSGTSMFPDVKQLHLWDVATGQCLRTFDGHTGQVHSVAFSPDGRFALSGSGDDSHGKDKTLRLWEVATGECLRTFEGHEGTVNSMAFSPDGRFALSGSGGYPERENTLRLWEFDWEYEYDPTHDPVLKHRAEPAPK